MCDKILNLSLILFFTVIIECTDAPSNLVQNSIRKPPSCRPNDHSSRMNIAGITPAQWVPTMLREVIEPLPVSGWEISLLAHLLTLLWHFFPGLYFLKYTCIGKFYSLCTIGPNICVYQTVSHHCCTLTLWRKGWGQKYKGLRGAERFGNHWWCMYYHYFLDRHINDTELRVSSSSAH